MEFDKVKIILSDADYISLKKEQDEKNRKEMFLKRIILRISISVIVAMIIAATYFLIRLSYAIAFYVGLGIAGFIGTMLAIYNNCGEDVIIDDNVFLSHLLKDKGYKVVGLNINETRGLVYLELENNENEVMEFILDITFFKVRKKTNILIPIINLKDKELIVPYKNTI